MSSYRTFLNNTRWTVGFFDDPDPNVANLKINNSPVSKEELIDTTSQRQLNLLPYEDTNTIIILFPVIYNRRSERRGSLDNEELIEAKHYNPNDIITELDLIAAIESFYTTNTRAFLNDLSLTEFDLRDHHIIDPNSFVGMMRFGNRGYLDHVIEYVPGVYYLKFEY